MHPVEMKAVREVQDFPREDRAASLNSSPRRVAD